MDSTSTIRIAFLILILISCLIVYYMFGRGSQKEGFLIENTLVDFTDQGIPANLLYDEYGNPLIDGYYFAPNLPTGKWETGTKDYKQYMLKSIPYGYVATADKKSIVSKTNVATALPDNNMPEWRELTFAEYTQMLSTPVAPNTPVPQGYFRIKKGDKYEIAKIPVNHQLLGPDAFNPNKTYLSYSGAYQDIPGYTYRYNNQGSPDWTGEFSLNAEKTALTTTPEPVPSGKYKIRLVTEYNADDTAKKVRFVIADIPLGYVLDSTDASQTNLISNIGKYDAASAKDMDFQYRPELSAEDKTTPAGNRPSMEAGVYYQFDKNGKLVEINYKESNFAPILYYMPGTYKFGSSAYVPTYEDSVYLSRETRNAQLLPGADPNTGLRGMPIINSKSQLGGFCTAQKDNKQKMEEKCNAVDPASCASTTCCVLLGGEKCVSGNENGPYMTANYTDYTLTSKNKDFYYYQGKCYGNC